jgi:hypothetical protein
VFPAGARGSGAQINRSVGGVGSLTLARGLLLPHALKNRLHPKVGDKFCLGSTYAMQLCRRYGYDPDERVRL